MVGFFDSWPAKRKFPVDMAGFAVNVQLLFKYPYATMPYKAGFEEDRFLSALDIRLDEIEPKAENCTRVCNCNVLYLPCNRDMVYHNFNCSKNECILLLLYKSTHYF